MPAGSARRRGGVFTNTDEAPPQTDEESWADLCVGVSYRSIRPESPALPLAARGGPAARRDSGPPLRSLGHSGRISCPRVWRVPSDTVASGLHLGEAGL